MISENLSAVVSWPTLLIALVVFGFAPGALLRVIVLAFHRDDPRRMELRAELHAVPRLERPFWVFEQLEVALFEGIWERVLRAATGRIIDRWHLTSGLDRKREHPDSFWIPASDDRAAVAPGDSVKLMFMMRNGWGERMWVRVAAVKKRHLVGALNNRPIGIPRLDPGHKVKFRRDDIIDIIWDGEEPCEHISTDHGIRMLCRGGNGPVGADVDDAERDVLHPDDHSGVCEPDQTDQDTMGSAGAT